MPPSKLPILALTLLATALCARTLAQPPGPIGAATIPPGTPLAVKIPANFPMKSGEPVRAELLYPIYVHNQLILPANTIVTGEVLALHPDSSRRINARLRADFTPYRIPVVQFDRIQLADGTSIPFSADPATDGAPIYRVVAPPPAKGGFLHREISSGIGVGREDLSVFIAPGRFDRLKQFVYSQLPYHPQRIVKNTAWTVETSAALPIPAQPAPPPPQPPAPAPHLHFWQVHPPAVRPVEPNSGSWIVQASLDSALSSETSKIGQPIKATVVQPILNPDHTVAVPQGSVLVGSITKARPARSFGRSGTLSFNFNSLILPDRAPQNVETTLTGADSSGAALALSSEGQVKSRPQDKLAVPLLLALMAARPLDQDSGHADHTIEKNGTGGAAGLGLIGTIVAIAGGSPYAAAGIGYYGAALSIYRRWIARGVKISFAKDTRVVLQTTPRNSPLPAFTAPSTHRP